MPQHTPTEKKPMDRTTSVPHHEPGGQFGKIGKLVTHPRGGCTNCGNKTLVHLDHPSIPGHKGTNRWCPDCGHKWLKEESEETEESIKTPFDPMKLKGEEVKSFAKKQNDGTQDVPDTSPFVHEDVKDIGKVELAPYGSSVVKESRLNYLVARVLRCIH
jgi:DNA-directed RNA polymerase subunit RPC12/RpoP